MLEPSPPAVTEPPFADDPVARREVPDGRLLVSPVRHHGDLTWDQVARERPDIAAWCAERWLGAWKPLGPLPEGFAETRATLHRIADEVVAAERMPENEIALRYTRGGFGTPFFDHEGDECQVRVEHGELVRQSGTEERRGADRRRRPRRGQRARRLLRLRLLCARGGARRGVRRGPLAGPALARALRHRLRARL